MINPDSFIASCRTGYHLHSVLNHRRLNLGYCYCPPLWSMGLINICNATSEIAATHVNSSRWRLPVIECKNDYERKLRRVVIRRNSRRPHGGERKGRPPRNDRAARRKIGETMSKNRMIYNRKRRQLETHPIISAKTWMHLRCDISRPFWETLDFWRWAKRSGRVSCLLRDAL